jgi:hypothetical protein
MVMDTDRPALIVKCELAYAGIRDAKAQDRLKR